MPPASGVAFFLPGGLLDNDSPPRRPFLLNRSRLANGGKAEAFCAELEACYGLRRIVSCAGVSTVTRPTTTPNGNPLRI